MTPILYYFLQVILCSGIMVGYYWMVLRNNRFHQYNRFYLLAIALFSWVVPFIKIQWNKPVATDAQLIQFFSVIADSNTEIESKLHTGWLQYGWQGILMMIYVLVGIVLLVGLIKSLVQIYRLLKTHSCKTVGDVFLILTKAQGAPFSFFRYIFWHESIDLSSDAGKQMMQHELTHVQQKHSIDKMFMQLVLIAGWFNPFFWLIKKEMEMIHEFIADKKAVANGDSASLAQMLLAAAYPQQHQLLTNPFFFSPIKRRLQMITNNSSPRFSYMRRLIVLPLLAIVVVLFAFRTKELRNAENISVGTIVDNIVDQIAAKTKPAFSPKNILLNKQYTVVINAGHGGDDFGASAFDGKTMEKTLTLELAKAIQYVNQNNQIKIILTRETDLTQTVYEIANYANQQSPDLFISLHCNTADKNLAATKNGMEIYIADKLKNANYAESYLLANQLANNLTGLDISMNGLKSRKEGIYVLQNVKSPAILLETGNLSNTSDLNQLKNESYQQKLAASILNGIQYYFSSKEKGIVMDTTILNSDSVYIIPKNKAIQLMSEGKDPSKVIKLNGLDMQDKMYFNSKSVSVTTSGDGKIINFSGYGSENDFKKFTPPTFDSIAPIYILDGIIVDKSELGKLNPNSIQTINVYKGKSAEAYGEEGKHGVIMITSKKGAVPNQSVIEEKLLTKNKKEGDTTMLMVEGFKLNSADGSELPSSNLKVVKGGKLNSNELLEVPLTLNSSKVVKGYKINANPLIIINGKPFYADFNEIKLNPTDIESVNILKKEAAIKIYGEAAEYGAMVIKTKSGKLPTTLSPPSSRPGQVKEKSYDKAFPRPEVRRQGYSEAEIASYDKVFAKVEVPASFPGGKDAWQKYLDRNLNKDLPVSKGAPPGKYKVIVSFIVSSDGTISNVKAENDPGYGTDVESVKLFVNGPKWVPAKQNGKAVTSLVKQTITFSVTEE